MDLQAEKIELIKLVADISSEKIVIKLKSILNPGKKNDGIEFLPDHLLTNAGMLISERTLSETWKNESDEEWAQYLKD